MQNIFVGLSGGVDSSVTAALLKKKGYNVTAVYMKNWSKDLPGMVCPWKDDYEDARRVAVQLDIPFKMYDFENEYRSRVVDYMLSSYQKGLTPNPDIMCNQEIKFNLFLETALADGADGIATGHYARTKDGNLYTAANHAKDQTYFLYRVTKDALNHALMPIGDFKSKAEVRAVASELGLATAEKKDSQGICFVGKVGIKDFLIHELGEQEPGQIIDQNGSAIGSHDGAIFYTIGQRQGLGVGGGLPYYVTGKDMAKNEVYVTTDLRDPHLWSSELSLNACHWIDPANPPDPTADYQVVTRYRATPVPAKVKPGSRQNEQVTLILNEPVRALTPGQSAVIYEGGDLVLGGGIVI